MPAVKFEVSTIFIIMVIINLTVGLTLLASLKNWSRFGLNYFAAFFFLQPVVVALFLFIGTLPDLITISISNSLLSFTYGLGYMGYCRFFNRPINLWVVIIPIIVTFICFTTFVHNFAAMVFCAGVISGAQFLITFLLILSIKEQAVKRSKYILLTAYGLIGTFFIARAIHIVILPESYTSLFDPIWINSLLLLVSIICMVMISLGILLMVSDRLLSENIELATLDFLTRLYNRHMFTDLANREIARAERNNLPTSLLMIDIDNFKIINDTYGHPVGDQILIHLAGIFKKIFRAQDVICRYGGEEFCVLLADTTADEALMVSERLRKFVELSFVTILQKSIQYTISIGGFTSNGIQKVGLDSMISSADSALYKAKAAGRNCSQMEAGVYP